MMNEPVELFLVEDNEDDSVLIEEAFAEPKLMNMVFKVRDGEAALAYLRQEGPFTQAKTMTRPVGHQYAEEERL